jgi:hypothetical protein
MNDTAFWRLVWKEYRLQRAFWLAMLGLTVLAHLFLLVCVHWKAVPTPDAFFWAALGLGAFYALGCGGTLFATEHEAETYPFQRALPVSAIRLFAAKIAYAVLSTAAMLALVWLLAALVSGWRLPEPRQHLALWGLWGMAAAELLAWGVLFSLVTRRPLVAVILAVSCASITAELLRTGRPDPWEIESYVVAVPWRALVVAILALIDLCLGYRWFREPGEHARRSVDQSSGIASGPLLPTIAWIEVSPSPLFNRLVWHHARQSSPMLLTFTAMVAPLALARLLMRVEAAMVVDWMARDLWLVSLPCLLAAFLAPPLMGACVFLADQSHGSFRFLAERGISPKSIWLSRQAVWFIPLGVGALAIAAPVKSEELASSPLMLGYVILAYASGQFFSMFFRSGILAAGFGIALSIGLCLWAALMAKIHISWWWSVTPIPLALLVCTWLRTSGWLVEKSGVKAMTRACLPLAAVALGLVTLVPWVRVCEIPEVLPGFSPEEFARPATPDQEATVAEYRRAAELMQPLQAAGDDPGNCESGDAPLSAEEQAWLDANRDAVAMVLEASRRSDCDFFNPPTPFDLPRQVVRLAGLLFRSGRQLESEGNLDAALERYLSVLRVAGHLRRRASSPGNADAVELWVHEYLPYWAARPGQTRQRVLDTVRRTDDVLAASPPRSDCIKSHYLLARAYLEGDPEALAHFLPNERDRLFAQATIRCCFWERTRTVRVLNLWSAETLEACARAESSAAAGGRIALGSGGWTTGPWWSRVREATPLWPGEPDATSFCHGLANIETHRRAMRSLLALEAWKLDHGRLPQSLEELLTDRYLERPPVDPFWGKLFQYYPKGVQFAFRDTRGKTIEPGMPFLWGPAGQTPDSPWSEAPSESGDSTMQGDVAAPIVPLEKALAFGCAFAVP